MAIRPDLKPAAIQSPVVPQGRQGLSYGVSVTDECIGWEKTEELLQAAASSLAGPLSQVA